MSNILGSTGDYYQMLQQSAATTRQVKINKNNLDALNRSVPLGEDETKKERVSSVLNQGFKKEEDNVSQETRTVDNGLNTEVSDTGTSANPGLQDIIDTTLNIQKMWLGDDYEWDANEARDFTTLLRLSEDPKATASRYIASKGLATNLGLDTKTVYDNLDEISQYYIGDVYDAHEVSFFQKIKNGFIRNDAMSLKYEYMLADQAGDTARAEELKKQIEEKEAELGDYTSAIPTSIYDKIETAVLENFAYMTQPALEGSLVSSVITALGIATAAAFPISAPAILAGTASIAGAGAVAMSGKQMYEWGAGDKYYSLMNDEEYKGVKNKGQAYLLATIEGVATATIETVMDGMSSRLLGKVTGNQISKIGINSIVDLKRRGVTNRAANAVYDWVTGALDEGFMNEAPEYILGELTSIIYKNSNGIADEKTWADRRDELMESIVDGIIVGGVYGALAIPSSLKSQRNMAIELRRTANASESLSEFQNATKDMKPEGLSDADFDTARTTIWNASQNQRREYLQKEFGGTVLESEEIASKELFSTVDPMTGEDAARVLPDGTVYRTDDNALYSEVQTDNKSGTQTVWYGNPDDGSVYGIVQISSDGDTQTVESVRVRVGYEGIRSEMVKDALGNTLSTETNVEWNPTTKGLQSVKEELINNNPNKTGLVYSSQTRGRDSDIQSLKTQIKAASPQLTDAEATMAARLTSIADVGTGTIKYEKATAENTKRNPADIRGATNLAKALIYTGQNADSSTFVHELFHAVASVRVKEAENLSNEIRTALQEEGTRSQLETFIKNNLAVWGTGADINTIMSSLSEIKENSNAKGWSVAQNENLARLYEAYRRSERSIRQSLPQAIRNLLEKLTQFMNKVYGTLKDTVPLNENIAKAYDSLMGFEDMSSETKRVESQGVFKEFQGLREKAENNILYREDIALNEKGVLEWRKVFKYLCDKFGFEKGKDNEYLIFNKEQGERYKLSKTNLNKMLSQKARDKSYFNGFSATEHSEAVLNVETLFENAQRKKIEKDKNNSPDIQEVERFETDFAYEGEDKVYTALFTAKKHADTKVRNGLYSVELTAIKTAPSKKEENSNIVKLSHVRGSTRLGNLPQPSYNIVDNGESVKLFQDLNYNPDETNLTREQWIQTRTENFRKWFKDSKVVDENGDPLVVLHGSQVAWDAFDMNEARQNSDIVGAFFSSSEEEAETYGYDGYVRKFYLSIQNPAPYDYAYDVFSSNQTKNNAGAITREALMAEGYDGVILREEGENDEYIVFSPNQIKSATDNNGDFSIESDSILYQEEKKEPKYKTVEEAEAALTEYRNKNGFKIDENSIRVNAADVHELYRLAEDARGEFTDTINSLKKELGIPDNMSFARPNLKGFDRVIEKAVNDYGGDVGRVIDVNGATFMTDSYAAAESSYNKALDSLGDKVVKKKVCITSAGYRDFKVNFKTSNGFIGELIILDENTAWVKDHIAHEIYNENRKLEPYLKEEKGEYKRYQSLFGMGVWNSIKSLSLSLDAWSRKAYENAEALRKGQYDNAGFAANLYAVSSDITELSRQLRSNFDASYSVGLSTYTLPSDATLNMDISQDSSSLLNGVSQISKYLTAIENNSSNPNVTQNVAEVNSNILAQDKLLEDIDSVADIESAEALAREEYESEREVSLSESDKKTAEHVFDIDSSLPDNWENIYESDSEDRLQKERELEESLPESDITPSDMERIEAEENEAGLIRGRKNLESSYRLFVEGNSPDIIYEGKDTHKDTIFKNAIKDETTLRQYLAIMGEAYLYDTSATNRVYEDAYNSQWNRWEPVPVTVPYIDDAYRQTLHERLTAQLSDRGLAGAMKSALTNADMSDAVIKKAQKELSDNARFYRNILALLMKREDMLPDSLITEVKGLDIPSRESLDIASVTEFAELAKKVNNERLRQKILSGTAKFGSDEDQAKYKELVTYTKELDKDIKEKTKEIESLEKKGEEYEKRVKELEELNKERMEILLDAEEIFNLLTDTFVPEVKNKEYRQQLAKNYSDLKIKYEMLSPTRESELQSAWTQSQVKEGGHAGWRQQYRGTKYGSEAWLKEITENYEDVKERIDAEYNKNRRQSYNKVAKEVIETVRGEVRKELNEARMQLIASSTRTLTMNSNKIYSTLSAIKSIADGTGAVIPKVDIEAMKATEKELVDLQKKVSKQETKIENLKEKQKQEIYDARTEERIKAAKSEQALRDRAEQAVYDARTEERWKAAKEKQAIFAKQAEDLVNQQYVVKRTIENLKEKQKQEIKDLKEEQRQKEKEKRAYQAIREEKQKIANYIMRPVSLKSVDYSKAKEIQAIQALIDPEFRREWIYDIKKDPAQNPHYGTMTVQQAKDYLDSLSDSAKIDLFSYMPQDLVERLTEQRKPLNDWTIAELEQMASSVEMLKNEGRAILQAKKDMRNAQAREIKRSILKAMGADSNNEGGSIPSSLQRLSEGKGFKARLHSIMFRTRRMQELAQLLDGGYGNKGAAYRLLVEEKRWHQDNEAAAIKKRYDAVEGFVNDKAIDRMTEKVTVDLGRGKTADFTVDQLAYAWLSQYDEENKAAVMYGSLMTEGEKGTVEQKGKDIDIMPGESTITREWLLKRSELIEDDEEFMKVARERYDALIKTAEKELTDRGLWDLVNAINKDFNNPDNTKRLDAASIEYFNAPLSSKENYLPIKRMAMTGENLDNATADSMFNLNANKVVRDPAKGFLIERIDIAPRHQKQVDMSLLGVWQNSVKEQEHLIEFAGYVKKLRSVFESQKSSEVEREVNKRWSPALMREVKDYIELVANPDSSTKKDPTNELFKTIRGRTGAAYLGWKVSGIVLQGITSPASAFSELKPWEVFGAYAQIGAHPLETIKTINKKSQMMKNRTMNQIVDEAVQRRNEWTQSKTSRRLNKFEEVGQIGLTLVDRYAVAGPWLAMYERTLREGDKLGLDTATSETRAVQRADEFILRTQPVGDPTELASFFRTKSEAAKTILQFQTSLNVVWNNITANTVGFIRQKKYASAIGNIVGYAVAGVLLGLVQNGYDDDDDGKDKALKTIYWSLSQGVGSIPVAGSSIDSLSKYLITGDYDWYMNKGISISPLYDKAVQALVAATGGDGWKALERSAEAVGIGMGLPVSGAKEFYAIVSEKSLAPLVGRE